MAVDVLFRRLRGAFGNATVWAGGWFAAALVVFATVGILGGFPDASLAEGLETALRFGIVGGIGGAAAAVSLKIAQHAASELPSGTEDPVDRLKRTDLLASAGEQEPPSDLQVGD